MPTGQDWYDSPQFKLMRMIHNHLHEMGRVAHLIDLLDILESFYPKLYADHSGAFEVIATEFANIQKSMERIRSSWRQIEQAVAPKWLDTSCPFAQSEIEPFDGKS